MPRPIPTKKSREAARGPTKQEAAEKQATVGVLVVGGIILTVAGLGTGVYLWSMASFQQSAIYVESVNLARHNPRVIEELGTPIEGSIWVMGEHDISDKKDSTANVQIPLSGPKGEGRLRITATQEPGKPVQWTKPPYFVTAGGKGISLR